MEKAVVHEITKARMVGGRRFLREREEKRRERERERQKGRNNRKREGMETGREETNKKKPDGAPHFYASSSLDGRRVPGGC